MAMIVQHNLTAMNSNRQLGVTTSAQAKSSEKLSSGYRINRAGDDAAGLKISEKMRSQVRGLNRASVNAQDGVSLIQTAEGALNEAHSILQRMNELAVQGANDTNESIDREAINEELDALTEELDRISTTTQFNKQNLLDGSFKDKNLHVGANADQKIVIGIDNMNAATLGLRSITVKGEAAKEAVWGSAKIATTFQNHTSIGAFVYKGMSHAYKTTSSLANNVASAVKKFQNTLSTSIVAASAAYGMQRDGSSGSLYYKDSTDGSTVRYKTKASAMKADITTAKSNVQKEFSAFAGTYLKMSTKTLSKPTILNKGYTSTWVEKSAVAATADKVLNVPKVDDYATANETLKAVQEAINQVSGQRSALGAIQNRLEHTIANLDNVAENTQAAESRIRDLDMAAEMVEYSKNNILAQAGQSMLAQANQSTQGVLSLLG